MNSLQSGAAPLGPLAQVYAALATPVGLLASLSLAFALTFAPIAPGPAAPPAPHWLLIALAFWAQRRPSAAPPVLVFAAFALLEGLRHGPFGPELIAALLAISAVQRAARRMPPVNVFAEWRRFAAAALGFEALVWLLLAATYAPTPAPETLALRALATIVAFPIALVALQRLTGLTRPANDFSHLGRSR